ncbi:MAG TPA: haloalkane dehalogenase [Actinomycetota bacterium]|nr:haloalkane dehalogenase [Actinomycetota bacterium]
MPETSVLDSTIHYDEAGSGDPVVFLHGNPTSSFLWRNVIPETSELGRCLAPDLIGFGRSGKPDIAYRFEDHARYMDGWFDELELERVTLVGHDWGGAVGFDWAARHPDRVRGIAFMETIVRPMSWDEGFPPQGRAIFQAFRGPEGEKMILDDNFFVEVFVPFGIRRTLAEEEMAIYRAPFREREDRRPMLAFPRDLPMDGEPEDVCRRVQEYSDWLCASPSVPKLLLTFDPGAVMTEPLVAWCRSHVSALEVEHVGPGIHYVQEDQGPAIGRSIAAWMARRGLAGS